MAEKKVGEQGEQDLHQDPHLLDLGDLQEVAMWLAAVAEGGVVGNLTSDGVKGVIRAVLRRFGSDRVAELEERVCTEMTKVKGKGHLANRDLRARVREIFEQSGF